MRRWAAVTTLALGLMLGCKSGRREPVEEDVLPLPASVRGANLRPVGDLRRGYGTAKGRETMIRLQGLGVNTVGVLIEGRLADRQATDIRLPDQDTLEAARAALLDARSLGLAAVLVPHLYLDDGDWRGYIRHEDPAQAAAFWASHDAFILTAAEVAREGRASALSIGIELKAMSATEDMAERMAALARRVRVEYSGQLTYSANWDEAEQVAFWSVVDLVGVNGYYPLVPDPVRGAQAVRRRLGELAEATGKQVLLLEVGYRSGPVPHVEPWTWPEDAEDDVDRGAQARAWAAVLTHWLDAPGVRGLLAWVVPTDPDDPASEPPHGFNPLGKPAEEVLRRAFGGAAPTSAQARAP